MLQVVRRIPCDSAPEIGYTIQLCNKYSYIPCDSAPEIVCTIQLCNKHSYMHCGLQSLQDLILLLLCLDLAGSHTAAYAIINRTITSGSLSHVASDNSLYSIGLFCHQLSRAILKFGQTHDNQEYSCSCNRK